MNAGHDTTDTAQMVGTRAKPMLIGAYRTTALEKWGEIITEVTAVAHLLYARAN